MAKGKRGMKVFGIKLFGALLVITCLGLSAAVVYFLLSALWNWAGVFGILWFSAGWFSNWWWKSRVPIIKAHSRLRAKCQEHEADFREAMAEVKALQAAGASLERAMMVTNQKVRMGILGADRND